MELLMAIAAAFGVALIGCLSALLVVVFVRLVERKRKRNEQDDPIVGDGAWPKTTGPYRTGVRLSHPEPADQVPDGDDRRVPRLPPDWPGLPPKPKRRAM